MNNEKSYKYYIEARYTDCPLIWREHNNEWEFYFRPVESFAPLQGWAEWPHRPRIGDIKLISEEQVFEQLL